MRIFALGLLGGTPQVAGIAIIGDDLNMRRWERSTFGEIFGPSDSLPLASAAKNGRKYYWASPFVSPLVNDTILNYRVALESGRLGLLPSPAKLCRVT